MIITLWFMPVKYFLLSDFKNSWLNELLFLDLNSGSSENCFRFSNQNRFFFGFKICQFLERNVPLQSILAHIIVYLTLKY